MDISTKQKIDKEIQALNETIGQLDLIDIHRAFHPKIMDFTIFACTHGTFPRIDHILVHKSSLGKLKNKKTKKQNKTKQNKKQKTEIISCIFSDYNAVKLDINYRRKKKTKNKHMGAK